MKNKRFIRIIAMILAVMMSAALICACSGKENGSGKNTAMPDEEETDANIMPGENTDPGSNPGIKGETRDYGIFTGLFVPESMDFTAGTMIDPESEEGFRLADKDNPMKYFYVGTSTDPESDIEFTKEMNEEYDPQDISFELNGNTWSGVTYKYNGEMDVFQIFTRIGDHVIHIMSAGYPYDGELVKTILASLKLA